MSKLVSIQLCPDLNFLDSFRGLWGSFGFQDLDFSGAFESENYVLCNTARSGLGLLIDVWDLPKHKKIALPAFCCCVMATPFLSRGYEIAWIDVDDHGLLDPEDLNKKIDQVSCVLVPHIFGQPADLESIYKISKKHDVKVIEDGAHGWFGGFDHCDAKLLSFGREKYVSCGSGGAVIIHNEEDIIHNKKLKKSGFVWTFRYLLYPAIWSTALKFWSVGGKGISWLAGKLRLLPRAVTRAEKAGQEDVKPAKLARGLQALLKYQLEHLDRLESHRHKIADAWEEVLARLFPDAEIIRPLSSFRVILKTDQAQKIRARAKQIGFDLREWDGMPIAPKGVNLQAFGYQEGSCPKAEHFAQNYVTFPTNRRTSLQDILRFGKIY